MATKEARQRAVQKYLEGKDEFRIRVDKGRKAEIQAHADAKGESLNGYVIKAIDERIEHDKGGVADDILSEDDIADIEQARAEFARGEFTRHEDMDWN